MKKFPPVFLIVLFSLTTPSAASFNGTVAMTAIPRVCGKLLVGFGRGNSVISTMDLKPLAVAYQRLNIVPLPGESIPGLAADPTTGRLYASTNRRKVLEIDPVTGSLIRIIVDGSMPPTLFPNMLADLSVQPETGVLFGVTSRRAPVSLVAIDTKTGQITEVGMPAWPIATQVTTIAFSDDGRLWAMQRDSNDYYLLDPVDGTILDTKQIVNGMQTGARGAQALEWLPSHKSDGNDDASATGENGGRLLFAECCGSSFGGDMYILDPDSGNATWIGTANGSRRAAIHDLALVQDNTTSCDYDNGDGDGDGDD